MGTVDPHLGPPKNPTRANRIYTWSPKNRGPNTATSTKKGGRKGERKSISRESVDTQQNINNLTNENFV